jgi:hypothetical protein
LTHDISQGMALVAGNKVVDAAYSGGKAADNKMTVEEDGGNLRGGKQVPKTAVRPVQFVYLFRKLGVDRMQLLVGRLDFFLGSFQLLAQSTNA